MLEARTRCARRLFQTRGPLRYAPTRIWRAMKFKVLLRKRGGVRARAAGAESGAGISNQPPRQGPEPPANIPKPEYKAPLRERCVDGLLII